MVPNWMSPHYEIFARQANREVRFRGRDDIFYLFLEESMQTKVVTAFVALGQKQREGHLGPGDASRCSKDRQNPGGFLRN